MNIRTFHSGRHIHHDSEYTNSEILSLKWRYLVEAPTDVRIFDDWIDDDEIFLVILCNTKLVVVHLSDHNRVMVAQVDYYIRANHSINGKGKLR